MNGGRSENLYKRGHVWWGRLKIAGREYRASLRTPYLKEARHRLKGWRQKLERAAVGAPDCPSLKAATVRWTDEVLANSVKPSVAKRYLVSIGQITDVIGNPPVDCITAATITEYASRRGKAACNATIRRDITALSRLLASCVAWGWRQDNPARVYDRSLLRERRDPIQPPSPADVEKVLAAAPPAMAGILRLLNETGMRANEATTLTAEDVRWDARQIALTRTKTNRPRTMAWGTPGGDAGPVLTGVKRASGPLFPSATGATYRNLLTHAAKVIRSVEARERKAGRPFRRFRVHDLRHGFAIRALRNGMELYRLSKHLGHSSVRTTEGYLAYLTVEEQEAAYGTNGGTKQRPETALSHS